LQICTDYSGLAQIKPVQHDSGTQDAYNLPLGVWSVVELSGTTKAEVATSMVGIVSSAGVTSNGRKLDVRRL